MSVELNHMIVPARNKHASAQFLAGLLGLEVGRQWGPFVPVRLNNGVTLDFDDWPDVPVQHYAFLVSDAEFDAAFARLRAAGIAYYADPGRKVAGEINTHFGGRGLYFDDPAGHLLEIITKPYELP